MALAMALLFGSAMLEPPLALAQTAQLPGSTRATPLPGARPLDLAAGAEGGPVAIDEANSYRWTGTAWEPLGMGGRKIDMGAVGPYLVTASNEVWYKPSDQAWQRIPGFGASNLGVGAGGHLFALGTVQGNGGFDVWRHLGGESWEPVPGANAVAIDVAPDGTPWIVNQGMDIFRHVNGQWQQISGKALDVAVGADGAVWVIDGTEVDPASGAFSLKRWTGTGWERAVHYGWNMIAARDAANAFSVGNDSTVIALTVLPPAPPAPAAASPSATAGQPAADPAKGTAVVNILCKYGDIAGERRSPQWVHAMFTRPGRTMESWWRDASQGNVAFTNTLTKGWYTVKAKSAYTETDSLVNDCIQAADADVSFPEYSHIAIWLNGALPIEASGQASAGVGRERTLDNQTKPYSWVLLSDSAMEENSGVILVIHEFGHTFRMNHSRSPGLDIESGPYCRADSGTQDEYGCWRGGPNAHNLWLAGWVPDARLFHYTGGTQRITLKHLTDPGTDGYLMARVPIGASQKFYTVEARKLFGVDTALPARGVAIHEVDRTREDEAHVMHTRKENHNWDSITWQPGQTFTDEAVNLIIRVEEITDQSATVTIGPR